MDGTNMKRLLLLALVSSAAMAYEYGPDPRYTAAPGDHPAACASAGCHSNSLTVDGPINVAGGAVTAMFSTGSSYTPGGSPITITVNVTDPKNTHFGFQMTARLESNLTNGQAGDFTAGTNQIVLCDDGSPKIPGKSCPAASPVQFVEHAYPAGSQVSTTPYSFTWTPPATNVGPVHFYVAGNAVNGDLKADGNDHVYTASYVLTPVLCPTGTPSIDHVISAGAFGALTDFASGSWVEIYGSNFASNLWQWQGIDFNGANAPTSLAGINVSINGKPAYVWVVSSGQINAQAPADNATGQVKITVSSCLATSNPISIQKDLLAPGLLAPPSFSINGVQYLVAFHQDGTYVGNAGLINGFTFSPAKPGETLVTYGVGFGDVKKDSDGSNIPPGTIAQTSNSLANPITFSFGSTPSTLQYKGLAGGYVGLYQFNVVVPNVANGDVPINVTLNSVALPQKLFLTVHN
jgi:uncharacterized protein (TIGR03437 family)